MGYHLIVSNTNGEVISHYAEEIEDFASYSDINKDSIIYQGEESWKPIVVGNHKYYKNLSDEKFRAGIKAEKLFKEQAISHGLMIENLSQDPESFKAYTVNSNDEGIKRGDYIIRNARNLEIEVKCFSYYNNSIYFKYEHYLKHKNMQSFTGSPIVIAFYERNGDSPIESSLKMISLDTINEKNNKEIRYDKQKRCFIIPVTLAQEKFTLIDGILKEITI